MGRPKVVQVETWEDMTEVIEIDVYFLCVEFGGIWVKIVMVSEDDVNWVLKLETCMMDALRKRT